MRLRIWLVENRVKQRELADALDISPAMASQYVNGISWPNAHIFRGIVDFTSGEVTYKDIIDEYLENPRRVDDEI